MSTTRHPISRFRQPPFPLQAIAAFREMLRLEELSEQQSAEWPPTAPYRDAWCEQHRILHHALGLRPWQFYCVTPPWENMSGEFVEEAKVRYRALCEAAGIELEPC